MKRNKKRNKLFLMLVIALCIVAITPIVQAIFLNDLEDVTIATPSDGEFLRYNSTSANWTNVIFTGATGNPFNQDLNTTDNVIFNNITANGNLTVENNIYLDSDIAKFYLGEIQQSEIFYIPPELSISVKDEDIITMDTANAPDGFIMDKDGIFTTRYQSACRVRLADAQSVPSGAWVKLLLSVEDYDQNNDYDNILFTRFNVPVDGLYQISYSVYGYELADTNVLMSARYFNIKC